MQNNLAHKKAFLRFNFQNSEPMGRVSYRFITQQNKLHSKQCFSLSFSVQVNNPDLINASLCNICSCLFNDDKKKPTVDKTKSLVFREYWKFNERFFSLIEWLDTRNSNEQEIFFFLSNNFFWIVQTHRF